MRLSIDYTLQTPEERNELVKKIIAENPNLPKKYLEILADYIIFAMDKKERKTKRILTENRMVTVNKRETTSIQAYEDGEDSLYHYIINDKNIILSPKISITQKDISSIPDLKTLREAISAVDAQAKEATGRRKYLLKKQVIEMRRDQYILKSAYKPTIKMTNAIKSFTKISLEDKNTVDKGGRITPSGFSLLNPKVVAALLNNYSKLKQDSWGKFDSDAYYLLLDLENLVDKTLKFKYPVLYSLLIYKIDGKSNEQIQSLLRQSYSILYAPSYISSLWRKKIPKLCAQTAEKDYLNWYFTEVERGNWKKCSRCGRIKLAHNAFFSKNSSSADGFYSICKDCRNAKKKEKEATINEGANT